MPDVYYGNLLPPATSWTRLTTKEVPQAGIMAIRQLGNCELLTLGDLTIIVHVLTQQTRLSDTGLHVIDNANHFETY